MNLLRSLFTTKCWYPSLDIHSLVLSLIPTILNTTFLNPKLHSQFRLLLCVSDSYELFLHHLYLTFPKMNWFCSSLKPVPPHLSSWLTAPPLFHLLKPGNLGTLWTILFLWALIQYIRKFLKIYPAAAPHFTQGTICLQWLDHPAWPLSTSLLPPHWNPPHSIHTDWALHSSLNPPCCSLYVLPSGPLHGTPSPCIFIVHSFIPFKYLLRYHLLTEAF